MNFKEVIEAARPKLGPHCKGCNECNGRACGNTMPGPGSKGIGDTAQRNYSAWKNVRINMDTICENREPDTSFSVFGQTFKYPIFAGPVGAVQMHYGDCYTDMTYNDDLVRGCAEAGIAAFTGDGVVPGQMEAACTAIKKFNGMGVPTVKPWSREIVAEKMKLVKESGAFAVAMDVDAAGLPFLKNLTPPAGFKTTAELKEIISDSGLPFIVKGIMTVNGALKAMEAGASGIVVSNHGGRVLDQCPSTCEVLPEIAEAVAGRMKIFVDGGIRSGTDIFKALAMGADAVIIARPYVVSVYGAGAEGAGIYTAKLGSELADTMKMCGVSKLSEITKNCVRL